MLFLFIISGFIVRLPELTNCYCLETDDFLNTAGKNTEKSSKSILPTVFPNTTSPLGTTTAIL